LVPRRREGEKLFQLLKDKKREASGTAVPPLPSQNTFQSHNLRVILYLSGPPEADADLGALHYDRYPAVALRELQHLRPGLLVFFDIPIYDRQPLFGFGLPGPEGKGSVLFAENCNLSGHHGLFNGGTPRNRLLHRENLPDLRKPGVSRLRYTAPPRIWDSLFALCAS
jgi:hypothetical protein